MKSQENLFAGIVQKRYTSLKMGHAQYFQDAEFYNDLYHAVIDESDYYPWEYKLVDPVVFPLIRSMLAYLNPQNVKVRLEARSEQAVPKTQINQDFLNWELAKMSKTLVFYNLILRGIVAGVSYLGTSLLSAPALDVKYGEKGSDKTKTIKNIINHATARNINYENVLIPNENNPFLEEQPYILENMMIRYGDMLDDNQVAEEAGLDPIWKPEYLTKIKEKRMFSNKFDYGKDTPIDPSDDSRNNKKDKEDLFLRSQYVACIKMQTLEGDRLIVPKTQEEWILNENEENPYWNKKRYDIIKFAPFPEDNKFHTMGIVKPSADLQIALSSTLNQTLTNGRIAANPMTVVGKTNNQMEDYQFTRRPNGVVHLTGDINDFKETRGIDTSDIMINLRRELTTSFERATNFSSLYQTGIGQGSSAQVNTTARGAQIIQGNMDRSMELIQSLLGQVYRTLGEHFLELNAQHITQEQEFKLSGKERFQTIKPEDAIPNFDIKINVDTLESGNPQTEQTNLINTITMLDNLKSKKVDITPILQSLFQKTSVLDDIDTMINDPEQEAEYAINSILSGIVPKVKYSSDHEAIIQIAQVYVMSNKDMPNDMLEQFATYLDKHRQYIAAKKTLVTMEANMNQPQGQQPPQQLQPPTDPNQLQPLGGQPLQLPPGAQPGQPPPPPQAPPPAPYDPSQLANMMQ